jgi:RimJ/RimL family protein N-acetyltransferase
MSAFIAPVTLTGRHAQLEPLSTEHIPELAAAVVDGELWKLWYTFAPRPETVESYVQSALEMRATQHAMPFAIRAMREGKPAEVVGTTRLFNVDPVNRRLEIGQTWHARSVQRTAINTECKQMLLTHAFEQLDCIAVEFRTHWLNHQSRAAIERLGAKQDGILRNHMRMPDGSLRDTVVFSIIASEWAAVKRHLSFLLDRTRC